MKYRETLGAFHAVQSMGDVGKCYDNVRMESWFATLKKEKLYRLDTLDMTVEQVKTEVWRYTFAYYNTVRVSMVNKDRLPPSIYRETLTAAMTVA